MGRLPTSFATEKGQPAAERAPARVWDGHRGETREMEACVERTLTPRGEIRGYSTPDGLHNAAFAAGQPVRPGEGCHCAVFAADLGDSAHQTR
jgi:hypothetical protein